MIRRYLPCFFIWNHDWIYDNKYCNKGRECRKCGEYNEYTLVECGMKKVWLRYKSRN